MSGDERPPSAVMIDRPGSIDRDDAIWVVRQGNGWRAWVHVADVARVVPLGGATDVAACRRGRTSYRPDRTVWMLPVYEQAQAALRAGRPVPTCVIDVTVADSGELASVTIGPGTLAEPYEASYEEAAQALTQPGHRLHRMLTDAYELAQTLLARRRAAGALAVYDLLRGWATDEDGRIVQLATPERNAGYLIVQELMIAANEAAAGWAQQRGVPILFRNHAASGVSRQELAGRLELATDAEAPLDLSMIDGQLATVLRPAVYELRADGHFGLNLPAYTHVTSPLRRYPDLVNQRIMLAVAQGLPSPYQPELLAQTAAIINFTQEANQARRAAGLRSAARQQTRARLAEADYQRVDDNTFGKLVRLAVAENRFSPLLAAEIERRTAAGRLLPREAATVLFGVQDDRWLPLRQRLLDWLASQPAHALTALSLYAAREYGGGLVWDEEPTGTVQQPMFTAAVRLGEYRSPLRSAPSKRAARQQAALALVAQRAGLPDPSRDLTAATPPLGPSPRRAIPPGHPPAMAVNELAQTGRLSDLQWSFVSDGAAHEPTHTCTVAALDTSTGVVRRAAGRGGTKAAAKAAAAAGLLAELDRAVATTVGSAWDDAGR